MEEEKKPEEIGIEEEKVEQEPAGEKKAAPPVKLVMSPEGVPRPYLSVEQMYAIGEEFSKRIFSDEKIATKLRASKMIIRMEYYDQDYFGDEEPQVTVDLTQDPIKFYTGPCEIKPVVIMRMHSDTAHRFWMQKANLMVAITKGQIKVKGPLPQVMKLLPIIKPSFAIYREVLRDLGHTELLNYPPEKKKKEEAS